MADNSNRSVLDLGQAVVECVDSLQENIFRLHRNTIVVFRPLVPPNIR